MATERRGRLGAVLPYLIAVILALTSIAFTIVYGHVAASGQAAQARRQDATIARLNATITQLNATIAQLRRQQLTGCNASADLGTVPLPAKPPPSRFAVRIVTDNRASWYGNGCGRPGSLPVPPGLAQAAARYGIPVNGKES